MRMPIATLVLALLPLNSIAQVQGVRPIVLPSYTAYSTPDPERPRINERGIGRWTNPSDTIEWFGTVTRPGTLTIVLNVELPEGEAIQYSIGVGNEHLSKRTVGGTGITRVEFPQINVPKSGPLRIILAAKQNSGPTLGRPVSIELSGNCLEGSHFNLNPRRNAASVHLNYPVDRNAKIVGFANTIIAHEDPVYTYYCAVGFRRGYLGMQVNGPTERRVIFSIWDSGSEKRDRAKVDDKDRVALLEKGDNVVADSFGNEGTGGHSHKVIDWRVGEPVSFLVTAQPEGATTVYTGYYAQGNRPKYNLIAKFRAPNDGNYLSGFYSFVENFGGSNGQLKREAEFDSQFAFTADGGRIPITRATFSHDATGRGDRLDYFADGRGTHFTLANGGFGTDHINFGTPLDHDPARAPRVEPTGLLPINNPVKVPLAYGNPATYLAEFVRQCQIDWPKNRMMNVIAHGHSVPAGYHVTPDVRPFESYPHLLHVALKERFAHAEINVFVTAIGGENAESGANRFEADVLSHKPDVVTIDYSLNDRGIGLERAGAAWSKMIEMALAKNVKVILLTPTPDQSARLEDPNDILSKHAELIRVLAAKYHVGLVDSFALFQTAVKSGTPLRNLMSQVNHPNLAGHTIVSKGLMEWFPVIR